MSGVAREEPILDVPPIDVAEVVDVDVPLPVVVPIHVDDGDTTLFVLDKEEVGVTVGQETGGFTRIGSLNERLD
ncbi:MAG: hypothetical protein AAB484_03330, partial [Patescibacteria group bacterium]